MNNCHSKEAKVRSIWSKRHISLEEAILSPSDDYSTETMKSRSLGIFTKSERKKISNYNLSTVKIPFKTKDERALS